MPPRDPAAGWRGRPSSGWTRRSRTPSRSSARSRAAAGGARTTCSPGERGSSTWRADEDALWSDLRKKWRQYVNKARSNGIVVRDVDPATEPNAFDTFHDVMREVSKRTALPLRSAAAFRQVWEAFAPTGESRLLFAEAAGGDVQAVLLLVRCGDKVVEPYGGMTEAGAESRANYLLKWEAIRTSKEQGATSYDMWGLIGTGIDHFKAGFGGREVAYVGAWDLPLSTVGALAFRSAEQGRSLYRAARRRLRGENLALPAGPEADA